MTINELKEKDLILFESIVGSHSYGLANEKSDIDIKGIYIQPLEDILGFNYIPQISENKNNDNYYEIRRFLELLYENNPNIMELLNVPEKFILKKDPIFDLILNEKEKFITKKCKNSFAGYAISQIKKARGLKKKIGNPVDKEKKSPLDFCFIHKSYNSIPILKWFKYYKLKQKYCALTSITHNNNLYALYYDFNAHNYFENNNKCLYFFNNELNERDYFGDENNLFRKSCENNKSFLNYKGIVKESDNGEFTSNEIRLSNIPIDERNNLIAYLSYNKESYTIYCKDYKEYWSWVENRNDERYKTNIQHDKNYDSKNMSHCHRLLDMAIEIAEGKGINVYRNNREELLNIKNGLMEYENLLKSAEEKIEKINYLYDISSLPNDIDKEYVNKLLIKIRQLKYFK
jgi:hypothetical protein